MISSLHGKSTRLVRNLAWMVLAYCAVFQAHAQTWPSKPLVFVTAGAPGDGLDLITRVFAQSMTKTLGQTIVVDNRPGGGGKISMEYIKNAHSEGYILGIMSLNNLPLAAVNPKPPYNPSTDFIPVALLCDAMGWLVVSADSPYKSVQELVTYAKSNPGKLNFASSGIGSIFHFYGEWLKQLANIDATHVPYKGEALAMADIVSGRVDYMYASGAAKPFVSTGKLRLLATGGPDRMADFPNNQTMVDAGYPEFSITGWIGLVAPNGVNPEIIKKLNVAVQAAVADPNVKKTLGTYTFNTLGGTSEEFAKRIALDMGRLGKIGKTANIQLD